MIRRSSTMRCLAFGAVFGFASLAGSSAAAAAPRDCKTLEQDQAKIAADARLAPGDAELSEAKAAVEGAQEQLEAKERERALQQAARDAALAKQPSEAASIQAAQEAFVAAATARDAANAALKQAEATLACQERFHAAARNFHHSAGVAVAAAAAADETSRVSVALRYQYAPNTSKAWEVSLEAGRFWLPERDPDRDTVMNAMYRWKFGTRTSAFVIGSGIGWLNRRFNGPWENHGFAVLGDVGVEFRINNACPSLRGPCTTVWPDLRASLQPWVPVDGAPVAVLFGVQVGGFASWGRMGP